MNKNETRATRGPRKQRAERGFSMVEVVVVLSIIFVVAAMAVLQLDPARQQAQANAAMIQVASQLRRAREMAIESRRDVQVTFIGNNQIQLTRLNLPVGAAPTVFAPIPIQTPVVFMLTPGYPDTPDLFGNRGPIEFGGLVGGPPTMMFQSDGTFIDTVGNLLNGSVFIGIPNAPPTARAVTVVGATGRIRMWKGAGQGWVQ